MKQQNIDLVVNVEKFFGLTDWASGSPPFIGWWKTRLKSSPDRYQPQRRWWNGANWSAWCRPGMSDAAAEDSKASSAAFPIAEIEWCGLQHPHPDGYSYQLELSVRTKLHQLKRR